VKIVLSWIKDYIDLSGKSIDDIANRLTMSGLEVESITNYSQLYENFITAEVVEKIKHPNADKLSVCKVNTGTETLQIVCGAPNVAVGQIIPLACEGAKIPNADFVIKTTKLRGQLSQGMICSESELGISSDHSGIMVLPNTTPVGVPLAQAIGYDDVVFEIGITPNRPDALSHIGTARDLAGIFNRPLKKAELLPERDPQRIEEVASLIIEDEINCPRYSAVVVKDCKVGESPLWMKNRLKMAGMRSINNIVDITNFVMLEYGQPLHAFDLDNLSGSTIVVKKAKNGTKFTTLDSVERTLTDSVLMICDSEKEVAIAGIMGGENSEVSENTTNILIESAYFNPTSVRKSARYFGLSSEASYRFERGTNFDATSEVALRAAQLMVEYAGGRILSGELDFRSDSLKRKEVDLRFYQVERILGYTIPKDHVVKLLKNIEMEVIAEDEDKVTIKIPGFRPDIEREIDLIEEVARIYGYEKIPTVHRITSPLETAQDDLETVNSIRQSLIGMGFNEIMNNSLQSESVASVTGKPVIVLNPLNADMSVLRTSLMPGALATVKNNLYSGERDLMLFETGDIFNKIGEEISSFDDFIEETTAVFLLTGKASQKRWNTDERDFDFYDLKGYFKSLLETYLDTSKLRHTYCHTESLVFEYFIEVFAGESKIGVLGKVNEQFCEKFDIKQAVYCAEIFVNCIERNIDNLKKYKELLKYPKIVRDFAFIFDSSIEFGTITEFIKKNTSSLLKQVDLFDIYENEKIIGSSKRSLAFTLEFYDENKTLTEEEVEKEFYSIIEKIKKHFGAVLRGN
jgi:phenylalanyl-tRNA synthetase beta chain